MSQQIRNDGSRGADDFQFSLDGDMTDIAPWTEIEAGRFMPRRVRGSFQGRALG